MVKKSVQMGISTTKTRLGKVAATTQETALEVAETTKKVLYNVFSTLLTALLVVSASLFMYSAFYYAYMPKEVHEVDINFQFDACPDAMGVCSFPNASLVLGSKTHQLMTGQPYSINMMLEVPDSPTNQALGMFMSCIKVKTKDGRKIGDNCKSNILEYRSDLLRVLDTFAFSPMFMDDPHSPATNIDLEIRSKFIQVYSAVLQVHAEFSGLRRILYKHPWFSTVVGVTSNIVILSVIILISWSTSFGGSEPVPRSGLEGEVDDTSDHGDEEENNAEDDVGNDQIGEIDQ